MKTVTALNAGYWGYVQFGSAAIAAQADKSDIVVSGCEIKLTAMTTPAPPYAFAAQASTAHGLPEGSRPSYVYALGGQTTVNGATQSAPAAQAQYVSYYGQAAAAQWPGYSYAGYGYGPAYGKAPARSCNSAALLLLVDT